MRVLVAYGAKRKGTEELARAVVEGLVEARHSVVLSAAKVDVLDPWDAVVVVGPLSAWSWPRDARRFVQRHVEALRQVPVWFFSTGLPGNSKRELPPPPSVARLARLVGAQCHHTFGGPARATAKSAVHAPGEQPDLPATRAWARAVGAQLSALPPRQRVHVPRGISMVRRLVLWLCVLTGVTAVAGGVALLTSPADARWQVLLRPSDSYLLPGLILLFVVGLGNLLAAALEARRIERSELAVSFAGAAVTGWIFIHLLMVRTLSWLQLLYFLAGLGTLGAARWLWRVRHQLASFGPQARHPHHGAMG